LHQKLEAEGGILMEERRNILIKNVFGLQGEGRGGILKLFYHFTLKLN